MVEDNSDFLKRLLATFNIEAREHIDALYAGVAELEAATDPARQAEIVEIIFREAHSLKGAARSVNLAQIESACQSLESTFSAMKHRQLDFTPALFEELQGSIRHLDSLLGQPATLPEVSPDPPPAKPAAPAASPPKAAAAAPRRPAKPEKAWSGGTVRVATDKLDAVFRQAEELLSAKLQAQQRLNDLRELHAMVAAWSKEWGAAAARHQEFSSAPARPSPWPELLERNTAFLGALTYRLATMGKAASQDQRLLGKMVDDLLEDMKQALMLPFSALTENFPRLVRDLGRDGGKEVELEVRGGELEADRRILDEIKDPLVHLLRNCVDHGIEKPELRVRRGKPARGSISVAMVPKSGNRVEIEVADDGAGIDGEKVRAAAARLGVLEPQEASRLDEREAVALIYQSGVSTSPIITEVSGRGLGLAIVSEKVDRLGGSIAVETQPEVGTRFRIELPLTLATYRGIVVRIGEQQFVLPTSHVEQSVRVAQAEVLTVENRETVCLNGKTLSLARLADLLDIPSQPVGEAAYLQVVVAVASGKRMAFAVDEVVGEQEVLVKSLGRQLARVRNIAAATVLGSGKAVPILNVADLLKSAQQFATLKARPETMVAERSAAPRAVLVVEDSITARSLLKGILEVAGYTVATAVDGIDGLTQLRSGTFDLVVSDVDMPRMNGFDLTARIRSDKKLADLPVVLVTALESREDRERGIDVGANAYIVKRSFEESNLLEVIGRLV